MSRDDRARLISVPLDPVKELPTGNSVAVTSVGLAVYTWKPSPDGEWFAYTQIDQSESDLIIVDNFWPQAK